jgi:hypothetical protein
MTSGSTSTSGGSLVSAPDCRAHRSGMYPIHWLHRSSQPSTTRWSSSRITRSRAQTGSSWRSMTRTSRPRLRRRGHPCRCDLVLRHQRHRESAARIALLTQTWRHRVTDWLVLGWRRDVHVARLQLRRQADRSRSLEHGWLQRHQPQGSIGPQGGRLLPAGRHQHVVGSLTTRDGFTRTTWAAGSRR